MTCWQRPSVPACVLLILLPVLAGCQTTRPRTATAAIEENAEGWVCLAFRPVSWSSRDTSQTVEQIREHNAVWGAVCKEN